MTFWAGAAVGEKLEGKNMLHLMSVLEQEGPAFAERSLITLMGTYSSGSAHCRCSVCWHVQACVTSQRAPDQAICRLGHSVVFPDLKFATKP